MTTYQDILDGYRDVFLTIPALASNRVLEHEPTAADDQPLLYSMFDSYRVMAEGQLDKHIYRTLHRICVTWQDNAGAEALLIPFLTSIPAALKADPRLGGRLNGDGGVIQGGYASLPRDRDAAIGVFVVIGGVLCRAYDFTTEAFYKQGRGV